MDERREEMCDRCGTSRCDGYVDQRGIANENTRSAQLTVELTRAGHRVDWRCVPRGSRLRLVPDDVSRVHRVHSGRVLDAVRRRSYDAPENEGSE